MCVLNTVEPLRGFPGNSSFPKEPLRVSLWCLTEPSMVHCEYPTLPVSGQPSPSAPGVIRYDLNVLRIPFELSLEALRASLGMTLPTEPLQVSLWIAHLRSS